MGLKSRGLHALDLVVGVGVNFGDAVRLHSKCTA